MRLTLFIVTLGLGSACFSGSTHAAEEAVPVTDSVVAVPASFDKIWFRPGERGVFGGAKETGLLTITLEGIEFSSKKESRVWPWTRVEMISYGRMSGDTDTFWTVLGLSPVAGKRQTIGFRDGQKFGYGRETRLIYNTMQEVLRRRELGPYKAPEGYRPFAKQLLQYALAVPAGWEEFHQSYTMVDGHPLWGSTIFSPVDLQALRSDEAGLQEALAEQQSGTQPALYVLRYEAPDGFTCHALKRAGRVDLIERLAESLRTYQLNSEPEMVSTLQGDCSTWGGSARAQADGNEIKLRFHALSDARTVYLFVTRQAGQAEADARFDAVVRSLKLSVAH